jgi:transposase
MTPETLRGWVRLAEVDGGKRPSLTTEERQRLQALERENRELRRANEILKAASVGSSGQRNSACSLSAGVS